MRHTIRRIALAATVTAALAACTNPMAPATPDAADAPAERPSGAVYQGGVG